jgi:hypothetical protein
LRDAVEVVHILGDVGLGDAAAWASLGNVVQFLVRVGFDFGATDCRWLE